MKKIIFFLYLKFQILDMFAKLWKVTFSFIMSVHLSIWNNWAPSKRIFMKFHIWVFFLNLSRQVKFH